MINFGNINSHNESDSLVDLETFNSKYFCFHENLEEERIINQYNTLRNKKYKVDKKNYQVIQIEIDANTHQKNLNSLENKFLASHDNPLINKINYKEFSIEGYLKRVANKILNKKGIKNVMFNLVEKEKIYMENIILFRKLSSRSNKDEYTETLVKMIMNIIKN